MFTQSLNAAILASESAEGIPTETMALIIGGGIFLLFMLMLLITMSYSNVGNRHRVVPESDDTHRQHSNNHGHH